MFAANGMNVKRIKSLVSNPPCECKCYVPYDALKKVCHSFWTLGKECQDAVLWSIQSKAKPGSTWHINGQGL